MVEKREAPFTREGCGRSCGCRETSECSGRAEDPSETRDASLAFLLPVLAFVAFLGVFGWLLKGALDQPYQTVVAMALALPATVGLVLAVRYLLRQYGKK